MCLVSVAERPALHFSGARHGRVHARLPKLVGQPPCLSLQMLANPVQLQAMDDACMQGGKGYQDCAARTDGKTQASLTCCAMLCCAVLCAGSCLPTGLLQAAGRMPCMSHAPRAVLPLPALLQCTNPLGRVQLRLLTALAGLIFDKPFALTCSA